MRDRWLYEAGKRRIMGEQGRRAPVLLACFLLLLLLAAAPPLARRRPRAVSFGRGPRQPVRTDDDRHKDS